MCAYTYHPRKRGTKIFPVPKGIPCRTSLSIKIQRIPVWWILRTSILLLFIMNNVTTYPGVSLQPHIIVAAYAVLGNELALSLFVFWIFTDNTNASFSLDNFAFFANRFNWWSYFHSKSSFLIRWADLFCQFPKSPFQMISQICLSVNSFFLFIYLSR